MNSRCVPVLLGPETQHSGLLLKDDSALITSPLSHQFIRRKVPFLIKYLLTFQSHLCWLFTSSASPSASAEQRGESAAVFTGVQCVYQSVLARCDLTYLLGAGSSWVKRQSFTIWGEIDGAFWPLGLRAYCVTFLNEKWMGGEMKLRAVERATAEAVDMIPPPHLTTLTLAISSTQHPARCRQSRPEYDYSEGRRQGQVEVDLQIGHSPQETIINKAVSGGSPLEDTKEPPHWLAG